MKSRRAAFSSAVALSLLAVTTTASATTAAKPRPNPDLRSNAFYILDESDSKVLAARNERVAVPIASITKLMTALVVLETAQPMDEKIVITRDDVTGTAGGGSRLAAGTTLTRADLLRLSLMASENRAAHALCRSHPGGLPACVKAMNANLLVPGPGEHGPQNNRRRRAPARAQPAIFSRQ